MLGSHSSGYTLFVFAHMGGISVYLFRYKIDKHVIYEMVLEVVRRREKEVVCLSLILR